MNDSQKEKFRPASLYGSVIIIVAIIAAMIAAMAFFYFILDIILIFVLAFILGFAINPIITFFEDKGVTRGLSVASVLIIVIGVIAVSFYFLIPAIVTQISALIEEIPKNVDKSLSWWDRVSGANPYLRESFDFSLVVEQLERRLTTAIQSIIVAATGVVSFIVAFVLVLVIAFFGLAGPKKIKEALLELIPAAYSDITVSIMHQINVKLGYYLRGVLLSGLIIGAVSIIGYSILGLNFALTLGIVAGILELVPLIGPIIAGTAAFIVALFQDPVLAIYVAVFALAIQQIENHFIIPKVMSHQVDLHPLTVIFSTLVMAKLLGIVGIFLAVPIAAIVKILIKEIYLPNIRAKS